jgi:hypothetical protein
MKKIFAAILALTLGVSAGLAADECGNRLEIQIDNIQASVDPACSALFSENPFVPFLLERGASWDFPFVGPPCFKMVGTGTITAGSVAYAVQCIPTPKYSATLVIIPPAVAHT